MSPRAAGVADRGTPLVRPLRVVVLEDCRDPTDSMAELIGQWGYDVRRAGVGTGDLEVAAACRPDVLLVDLGTPGADECGMARSARRLPGLGRALLIAVTGPTGAGSRRLAAAAGFDYCVPRPVDPNTLETLLLSRQVELSADPARVTPAPGGRKMSGDAPDGR